MKNKLSKILSSLLIVSFLISALAVFASAEANTGVVAPGKAEERTEYFKVFYNRNYEEGWDYSNGFKIANANNKISIDYEEDHLRNYNYFMRYEALTDSSNCYTQLSFTTDAVTQSEKNNVKGTVVELSIKADDLAYLGKILWMKTSVSKSIVNLLAINDAGKVEAFPGLFDTPLVIDEIGNEWINIAIAFDWTKDDMVFTLYTGHGLNGGYQQSQQYSLDYPSSGDVGMYELYVGISNSRSATGSESIGMSLCVDNLKVYHGSTTIMELNEGEYGSAINTLAEKTIDIKESAYVKSKAQLIEEALAMKVGVDQALARNERYSLIGNSGNASYNGIYGAPVKQGDNVLVPLQLLLDYIGFPSYTHPDGQSFDITTGTSKTYITLGRSSATVDGNRVDLSVAPGYLKNTDGKDYLVIALSDIPVLFPGWLALYDDMGLIIVYEDSTPDNLDDNTPLVNRDEDLSTMVDTMKKFVYKVSDDVSSAQTFINNGTQAYNEAKANTGNFAHPYLIANADTFAAIKASYALTEGTAGYNATYKAYIDTVLAEAETIYAENADSNPDGSYKSIKDGKEPLNPYADGKSLDPSYTSDRNKDDTVDGYDTYGKLPILVDFAEILPKLAFAYQITGNNKYAELAYDWSLTLAGWAHWGPGYMQDCAEATSAFAIGYDWLYNAYTSLGLDTTVLANAIYNLGVHDGYVASTGAPCQHARSLGDMSVYNTRTDSQNAIATSGMVIGSLAILDYITAEGAPEDSYDETIYLLGNNLVTLFAYGLDMYAPNGAYIESALHWERATSNLVRMAMALDTATGTDYGYMSTWGLDKSCYYAIHIESSDGVIWNYHDGGSDGVTSGPLASLNTDMFNFVAKYLGDPNLYAVRRDQIAAGKSVSIYDVLFYPTEGIPEKAELTLDYYMEGVEAFVSRSDWTEGSMYTGLMGGMNNATNGQVDSGNFIYHNKGIAWVMDLGTENPNIAEYYTEASRYKFYRASAEGHNVVIMTSNTANIAYGQYTQAGGTITRTFSNEFGSYAVLDNKSVYLGEATYANRGVLVTNNRETVVLQDEFAFVIVESLIWTMHTAASVEIDEESNNRVAYLSQMGPDGKPYTLRATIVSPRPDFTFSLQDVTKSLLTTTMSNYSGAEPEYERTGIKRLTIEATTISFDAAVVFEIIDTSNETPVEYTWTPMSEWEPVESSEIEETVKTRGEANKTNIKTATEKAESILKKKKTAFAERLEDLYRALTLVAYTLKTYPAESLEATLATAYGEYLDCVEDYEDFFDYVNEKHEISQSVTKALTGINFEDFEADDSDDE